MSARPSACRTAWLYRQPFPGPGLGVRCLGAITRDRLEAVRESDAILREEFAKNGLEGKVWQYFTIIPDFKSVGVKEGKRSFEWPVIIRAREYEGRHDSYSRRRAFCPAAAQSQTGSQKRCRA